MRYFSITNLIFALIASSTFFFACKTQQQVITTAPKVATTQDVSILYQDIARGENIKLENMVYYLDEPLLISGRNNFIFDGGGASLVMRNKNEDVMILEYSNNVTLKNFKATHIEPDGPIGCTGSVLQVRDNDGVLIEKCELNGSGIIGVTSYNTKNLKVVDNYIYNNSEYGVLFDTDSTVEITGNKFEDNGKSGQEHVVKALNAYLSEVEKIGDGTIQAGIKVSGNTFK